MGKKFDKKSAKTYSVVHRPHDDALYFDNDASQHVLVEKPQGHNRKNNKPQQLAPSTKVLDARELERRLSPEELASVQKNEGLAAQYGVFFDDSKYDYMQHLRPIGETKDGVFIEADADAAQEKPKRNNNIEDLFKDAFVLGAKRQVAPDELENIPRELQGFNPDLDPRLREVLEALDDDAYVENEAEGEDDIFTDLLQSGVAEDDGYSDYDDDGEYDEWDMDNHSDEFGAYDLDYQGEEIELDNPYGADDAPADLSDMAELAVPTKIDNAWEKDFRRFKQLQKNKTNDWDSDNEFDDDDDAGFDAALQGQADLEKDTVPELPNIAGKRKPKTKLRKKMGAMTDTSSFSMSSSALFRTEGLTLLDDRFEQMAKKYDQDEQPPADKTSFNMHEERQDLEGMLDEFLDNYELGSGGRKLVKKDDRIEALRAAADSVSRGKAAQRRKREQSKLSLDGLGSSFGKMTI